METTYGTDSREEAQGYLFNKVSKRQRGIY
jgi:hypothetical protein